MSLPGEGHHWTPAGWLLARHVHAADRLHLLRLLDHRAAVAAADRDQVADEAALNAFLITHLQYTRTHSMHMSPTVIVYTLNIFTV